MAYPRKPRAAAFSPRESSVMKAVEQWLELRQMKPLRMNSGAAQIAPGRFVRFGIPGMSDLYTIGPAGISIWIECKRPAGGKLSEAQRGFLDWVNGKGGVGIVVNSIESLERQLKEAGVI